MEVVRIVMAVNMPRKTQETSRRGGSNEYWHSDTHALGNPSAMRMYLCLGDADVSLYLLDRPGPTVFAPTAV